MTNDEEFARERIWWREPLEIEDADQCEMCNCYCAVGDLLGDEAGPLLCLDCTNIELKVAELSGPQLLALEDQRDANREG